MNMTKALLVRTREILGRGWIQFQGAADAEGKAVFIESDKAVCFCSFGAMERACWELGYEKLSKESWEFFRFVRTFVPRPHGSIMVWNDAPNRTKEEVLSFFQNIIDKCDVVV
jgi:hypothetical protein